MPRIEFTDNYQDLSTESGYQFKFCCERCGNGYMSTWKASKSGVATGLLRGAGSMFGGFLGSASAGADRLQDLVQGPGHDAALQEAVEEIRPLFTQCKRCGQWVCEEVCWNKERGLCVDCAPMVQREVASLQAQITIDQAGEKLREQDLTEGLDLKAPAVAHLSVLRLRERGRQVLRRVRRFAPAQDRVPQVRHQVQGRIEVLPRVRPEDVMAGRESGRAPGAAPSAGAGRRLGQPRCAA